MKRIVAVTKQHAEFGLADSYRVKKHGLEYRLKLAGRARDYLENLRCSRLLLQRLGGFARTRLDLVEQANVFDCDHRLVGKGGHQFDLLGGKLVHCATDQHDHADGGSFTYERDAKNRARASRSQGAAQGEFGIGPNIGNLNNAALE